MTASIADEKLAQLVQKIDPQGRLLRAWRLTGGVSAQVIALEIEVPDGLARKMLVRRHGDVDLRRNPHIAAAEFRLLEILQSVGLPTPKPYYLDQSGEIFATPYLVVEYIEGKPEFAPADLDDLILQLAAHLPRIHDVDWSNLGLSFLPRQEAITGGKLGARPASVDRSLEEGRIRDTLESVWPLPQRNESVLLHGDFWPGNILWKDGRLVGIVDWEDAALGDPLADLANSRLEILWAYGIDAMHRFTQLYESITEIDLTHLPYWDLYAALRPASRLAEWAADEVAEKTMREGHRLFITQAFERLSV
jgi:aminoglycoside phosphotransferase (APT) family kinase protein